VRYDRRGHGKSGRAGRPPTTWRCLGRDALAVLDAAKVEKTNWCGLSMGGMVGMWMAANAPQRVDRAILSNTSSYMEAKQMWSDRISLVKEEGPRRHRARHSGALVHQKLPRQTIRTRSSRSATCFLATKVEGFMGCAAAVRDMDHRPLLPKIKAATLVIAGTQDAGTTPEMGEYIKAHVPGAQIKMLEAAHIANIEQQSAYTDTMLKFLRAINPEAAMRRLIAAIVCLLGLLAPRPCRAQAAAQDYPTPGRSALIVSFRTGRRRR